MIVHILEESLKLAGFVGLMMLIIEYINVRTRGAWLAGLEKNKWIQYLVAILLGATPGCFGVFAVAAMYSHRTVSFGALVATMIATSGDEAFVMFALFPGKAALLTAILIMIAFVSGWLTDLLVSKRMKSVTIDRCQFELHDSAYCDGIPEDGFVKQWLKLTIVRILFSGIFLIFIISVLAGILVPTGWGLRRISLLIFGVIGFFIIVYAPDHFLRAHLWKHVILKHMPGIFLWTFGALLISDILNNQLDLEKFIQANTGIVLLIAALVGIIPESGPHLVFVTLYSQGVVPFAVLLASSIVQDGHGMLPVLAESRKTFIIVKSINLLIGLVVGFGVYFAGQI